MQVSGGELDTLRDGVYGECHMSFSVSSVSKSRPFRSLGLYRSNGKHAAPKGFVPGPRSSDEITVESRRPAHAATMPRLTGPHAGRGQRVA
jgi:hypothetical protein